MIQNQYQLRAYNAASGSVTIALTGNVTVHTINFPKASAGVIKLANGDGSTNTDFIAASVGCMILDASFPNGLIISAASAENFQVTYQIP